MFDFATEFKFRLGLGQFDLSLDVLQVQLCSINNHNSVDVLADIPALARVGAPVTLTGVLWDGSLRSDDVVWTGISADTVVNTVALYKVGASELLSPVLGFSRYPRLLTTGGDVKLDLPAGLWFVL